MSLASEHSAAVSADDSSNAHLENVEIEAIPLAFAQQRLWFIDQLKPGSPLYNVPSALRISGKLDQRALQASLEKIIERHEILRTVYNVANDSPVQEIRENFKLEFHFKDLSGIATKESELARHLNREAQRPFDLSSDLMMRACLLRLAKEEHVLFLNIHHIACDEWSMGILHRELASIYSSLVLGDEPDLRELPIQYADFALWQREWMRGEVLEKQLAYWSRHLGGELPVLELPADRSRPAEPTYKGGRATRVFPNSLSGDLKKFSRESGVTLFITLLAAFKTLLHRYTSQEDLIIGTPIAGRNRVEMEELIGFFVNTLALRTKIFGELNFREVLERVRETSLGAFAHQDLPFDKLVEELQPERNASQNPIFNVMFAVQNQPEEIQIPGLKFAPFEIENSTAKFDLTLVFQDNFDGLHATIEFSADIFEQTTAERFLAHLEMLMQDAMARPQTPIRELNYFERTERDIILIQWNETETNFPAQATVHQLFQIQAERAPNAIAAAYGDEKISYRELDERSSQLANFLQRSGVGPDVLVGICAERSIEMLVGWLGILKAGGAYVPLDPGYPAERLEFMLQDAKMPILLTQRKLASRLPKSARKLCLDSDWKTVSRESTTAPANSASSENLAYVIYTSGSTGQPKGVGVLHRGITRLVVNTNYIQLGADEKIAQASNSSFDAATFEIWGALLHGGQLIGVKRDILLSPMDFVRHLHGNEITTIFLTTALFNQIAADIPDAFHRVKNVLFGGEACDPRAVKEILTHGPPRRLLHVYGPTETTTFASWFEINSVSENAATIPIGRPISNTTFYVVDRHLQPVPVGVPGELLIGGPGVARGYLNRPDLTDAKFIPNPFSEEKSERLYRTGDLVRWLPEGNIEFIGRIDNQVKIRGFRIELEEIESVLEKIESVQNAVVLARGDHSAKRLVAYIVPRKKPAPGVEELRQILNQKLPDFMVPSAFVFLDKLPLTPNGKINRQALPAPQAQGGEAEKSYLPPRNNLENQLRKIWENVLSHRPIGVRDNFFELGGHSLLAVRLFTQIERKMGPKLPLSTLFNAPTIEQLAQIISAKKWSAPGASLVEIQSSGSRPPIFWLHTLGGGGGGGLFTYRKLSQCLGPDQPSYGLVTPPEPFTKIEEMAAHYISEMRTLQPVGPYYLGGYCFGGVIAFEMARQLEEKGSKVALLALIESVPPNCQEKITPELALHFIKTFPSWLQHFASQGPSEIAGRVRRKIAALSRRIVSNSKGAREEEVATEALAQLRETIDFSNYPADFKRYAQIHWKALGEYRPKPFAGRITLFRTRHPHLLALDSEKLWGPFAAGGVDLKLVPGTHEKVLEEPYVQALAKELSVCLSPRPVELLQVQAA